MNNNSSATVMLGLEGMAVPAASERDGELEYATVDVYTYLSSTSGRSLLLKAQRGDSHQSA